MSIKRLVTEIVEHLNDTGNTRYRADRIRTIEAIQKLVDAGYELKGFMVANLYYCEKFKSNPPRRHPDKIYTIKAFASIPEKYSTAKLAEMEEAVAAAEMKVEEDAVAAADAIIPTIDAKKSQPQTIESTSIIIPSMAEIAELGKMEVQMLKTIKTPVGTSDSGKPQMQITEEYRKEVILQPILEKDEALKLCKVVKHATGSVPKWRLFPRRVVRAGKALPGKFMSTVVNSRRFLVRMHLYEQDIPKAL